MFLLVVVFLLRSAEFHQRHFFLVVDSTEVNSSDDWIYHAGKVTALSHKSRLPKDMTLTKRSEVVSNCPEAHKYHQVGPDLFHN